MSTSIVTENVGTSFIIRFNRPEIRSPLSIAVLEELSNIVDTIAADKLFTSLIFTGTDGSFASGADLREIAALTAAGAREFALRGQSLMTQIADLHVLTIAAVNGFCFGGALDLALACKMRIASEDAVFSHPGAHLGIMTGWGGTQRLPRLVGEAAALEMFITAKRVSASEAFAIGLANEVASDPLARAIELAESFPSEAELL